MARLNTLKRMMKALLGIISWLVFPMTAQAQNISVTDILNKVNQAVLKLNQGQFTFHDRLSKYLTDGDSSSSEHTIKCFFQQTTSDSLMGYQLASFREDGYQQIYDSNSLLIVFDHTLEVTDKQHYSDRIKERLDGFTGPTYLINTNRVLQYFNKPSSAKNIHLLGLNYFLGEKCYKLTVNNSRDSLRTSQVSYYVSTNSFLPLRTVSTLTSIVGKTKETLVFDYSVTGIKRGPLEANQFSREKLSDYRVEKKYNPAEEDAKNELLPIGSSAPNWKLPLINGDTMELANLRGKIVIMDFWFKACAPCQKQMIALQTIHEKFRSSDVVIIGINTIDDPKRDRLELFLKNRLVSMPSVYKGNTIESLYKVYGSPALLVIDKQGVIVYTASGYSSTLANEVEHIIVKELK